MWSKKLVYYSILRQGIGRSRLLACYWYRNSLIKIGIALKSDLNLGAIIMALHFEQLKAVNHPANSGGLQ